MSTVTTLHPQHRNKPLLAAALGAALALALAVSIGAWQLTQRESGTGEEAVTRTAPVPAAPAGISAATHRRDQFTIYIVESENAGALLRGSMASIVDPNIPEAADLMRFEFAVAASSEDELRIQQELNDLDNVRISVGLPSVRRIDLRQPAAPAAAEADAPPVSDQEMYQSLQPPAAGGGASSTGSAELDGLHFTP